MNLKGASELQVNDVFNYIAYGRHYESRVVNPGVVKSRIPGADGMVLIYCEPSPRGMGFFVSKPDALYALTIDSADDD